jgi:hypothetical protein
MSVTHERQVQIVVQGVRGAHGSEPSGEETPPKGRGDLDVTERRGMEVGFIRLEDACDFARAVCLQEVFDEC